MTVVNLRPMLPADVTGLAAVFRASIEVSAADDYDDAQREVWAGQADDAVAFGRTLTGALTLVATREGAPVGFASLAGTDKIAMLYVDPAYGRQGVASMLLDALVRLASARGAVKLSVDASDSARDFFAARGFGPAVRNTVSLGDQWLGNTTMTRNLTADVYSPF